jgi:hypothetical protein
MWLWHSGWWVALIPLFMIVVCVAVCALMRGGRRAGCGGCCGHRGSGAESR